MFNNKNIFARFARPLFVIVHFAVVLVLSTTWNDLFCGCVDDVLCGPISKPTVPV